MHQFPEHNNTTDYFIHNLNLLLDENRYLEAVSVLEMMNLSLIEKTNKEEMQKIINIIIQLLESLIKRRDFNSAANFIKNLNQTEKNNKNALSAQALVKIIDQLVDQKQWTEYSIKLLLLEIEVERGLAQSETDFTKWQAKIRKIIQYSVYAWQVLNKYMQKNNLQECGVNIPDLGLLEDEILFELKSRMRSTLSLFPLQQQNFNKISNSVRDFRNNNDLNLFLHKFQEGIAFVENLTNENNYPLARIFSRELQEELSSANIIWGTKPEMVVMSREFLNSQLLLSKENQTNKLPNIRKWSIYRDNLAMLRKSFLQYAKNQKNFVNTLREFIATIFYDSKQAFITQETSKLNICPILNGSLARKDAGHYSDIEYMVLIKENKPIYQEFVQYVLTLFTFNIIALGESFQINSGFGKVTSDLTVNIGLSIDDSSDPIKSPEFFKIYVNTPYEVVKFNFPREDRFRENPSGFSCLTVIPLFEEDKQNELFIAYEQLITQSLQKKCENNNKFHLYQALVIERMQEQCDVFEKTFTLFRNNALFHFSIKENFITPITLVILLWRLWENFPDDDSYYPLDILKKLAFVSNDKYVKPLIKPHLAAVVENAFYKLHDIRFHLHIKAQSAQNLVYWQDNLGKDKEEEVQSILWNVCLPLYAVIKDFLVDPESSRELDISMPIVHLLQQYDLFKEGKLSLHDEKKSEHLSSQKRKKISDVTNKPVTDISLWIKEEWLPNEPPQNSGNQILWSQLLQANFHNIFYFHQDRPSCQQILEQNLNKLPKSWRANFIDALKKYLNENTPSFLLSQHKTNSIKEFIESLSGPKSISGPLVYSFTFFVNATAFKLAGISLYGLNISHHYNIGLEFFKTLACFDRAVMPLANLKKTIAHATSFVAANLSGANLTEAHHQGARYDGADLSRVEAKHTNFSQASFHGTDMRYGNFQASCFYSADLSHARLDNVNLQNTLLQNANLSYVQGLRFANLNETELNLTLIIGSDIIFQNNNEKLQYSDLVAKNKLIKDAKQLTRLLETDTRLNEINLSNLTLRGQVSSPMRIIAKLKNAILRKIEISHASIDNRSDLSYSNLSGAILNHVDLSNSVVRETNMSKVQFFNVDFSGADLSGSCMKGVQLSTTDFTNAVLQDVDLSGTKGIEKIKNANLEGANLQGADLRNVMDFSGINLKNADLRNALLIKDDKTLLEIHNAQNLKGCLLPDSYIHALESNMKQEQEQGGSGKYLKIYSSFKQNGVPIEAEQYLKKAKKMDKRWQSQTAKRKHPNVSPQAYSQTFTPTLSVTNQKIKAQGDQNDNNHNWASFFYKINPKEQLRILFTAVKRDQTEEALMFINKNNSLLSYSDESGLSVLHIAVLKENKPLIRNLLDQIMKRHDATTIMNSGDFEGQTPLHFATMLANEAIKTLLIEQGARKDVSNHYHITPADIENYGR